MKPNTIDEGKCIKRFGGVEPIKVLMALENGFYYKPPRWEDYDEEPKISFWKPRTFFLKYIQFEGWCFARVHGGTIDNKTEEKMCFSFSYKSVPLSGLSGWKWALTKEELE